MLNLRNQLLHAPLLMSVIVLCGAAQPARAFDAALCPAILPCSSQGCINPNSPTGFAQIDFHGVKIPDTSTNYPLINAGLYFLHQHQSEQFLLDALTLLCHQPPSTTIDCDDPLLAGQLRGAQPDSDVFRLWDQIPVQQASSQQAACRDYARDAKSVADMLLSGNVGLQSSPFSTEGIQLRLSLLRALELRPAVESRCHPATGSALSQLLQGQCSTLGQYLDDLRFAHLLADKLSSDNAPARSWTLLRVILHSVDLVATIATVPNDTPEGRERLGKLMTALLSDDWNALRTAIQQSL